MAVAGHRNPIFKRYIALGDDQRADFAVGADDRVGQQHAVMVNVRVRADLAAGIDDGSRVDVDAVA